MRTAASNREFPITESKYRTAMFNMFIELGTLMSVNRYNWAKREMNRDNNSWLSDLRHDGSERELAISDLRKILFRNLRKALSNQSVDESLLEDAVQDSLLRILDRLDQFQGRSKFLTWSTAIAIRTAMGELRRSRWKDISLDEILSEADFVPERVIDSESSPADQAERRAILNTMQEIIEAQLTEKQRTALLAELKGMPQDEIARHLNSNRNAIYKLTHDARKKLKQGLESVGYTAKDIVNTIAN